jgi:FKBP-type peptidyl-prolyl cis-trans isomerase
MASTPEGLAFLAANKDKEGVVTLPSGLQYKVITEVTFTAKRKTQVSIADTNE